MDKVRSLSLESLNFQSFKAQYVIKITQLLVSVSVCSFLFSPSSLLAFLHYFNFYFSTFPLHLFTHTIDKNCMFLLCNGLLVFVGITRSFSSSSGSDDEVSSSSSKYVDDGSSSEYSDIEAREPLLEVEAEERSREPDELNIPSDEAVEIKYYEGDEDMEIKAIVEHEVEQQKGEEELKASHLTLEDEETGMLDAGEKEEEEEGSKDHDFLIEEGIEEEEIEYEEEEDDDDAENYRLSTEELNKKFDDFIRRMREDLRIEARQQLIMV
ncbi:hypothetical protein QN277_018438 [Acacia crassicarpa]|uniref:DUF4408 domain-containing protein n=1 Tax=Acacia crassicarpa TaxID=499986 RepID=A0AAE1JWB0_9FABA|nr:hypothetical protein QN277_018438 [Acacia crassicarpa]